MQITLRIELGGVWRRGRQIRPLRLRMMNLKGGTVARRVVAPHNKRGSSSPATPTTLQGFPSSVMAYGHDTFPQGKAWRGRVWGAAPHAKAVHPKTFPPQGGRWMAEGQTDEGALDRTKGKSVLPAHPHPPQCAHWSTFPLQGGRFGVTTTPTAGPARGRRTRRSCP